MGLTLGRISGPDTPTAKVTHQSLRPGSHVALNESIDLTTTEPSLGGLKSVVLFNNIQDEHGLFIWLFDGSMNTYAPQNGGELLAYHSFSSAITLQTGHSYLFYAVDPTWCNTNDPTDGSCVRWNTTQFTLGDENGTATSWSIQ